MLGAGGGGLYVQHTKRIIPKRHLSKAAFSQASVSQRATSQMLFFQKTFCQVAISQVMEGGDFPSNDTNTNTYDKTRGSHIRISGIYFYLFSQIYILINMITTTYHIGTFKSN